VISVEDWALIRRLAGDGVPRQQIARQFEVGRSTVDSALASNRPPKYERPPVLEASFSPSESRVRALLTVSPEAVAWLRDRDPFNIDRQFADSQSGLGC